MSKLVARSNVSYRHIKRALRVHAELRVEGVFEEGEIRG